MIRIRFLKANGVEKARASSMGVAIARIHWSESLTIIGVVATKVLVSLLVERLGIKMSSLCSC